MLLHACDLPPFRSPGAAMQIFERAPVEAQNLLAYTYIVEEEDVIAECYTFFTQNWRRVFKRMGFHLSCGLLFRVRPHNA